MVGGSLGRGMVLLPATPWTRRRPSMAEGPWFYCLKHHTVETRDGCAERHRLGPCAPREEVEPELEAVHEREEGLSPEGRAWEGASPPRHDRPGAAGLAAGKGRRAGRTWGRGSRSRRPRGHRSAGSG